MKIILLNTFLFFIFVSSFGQFTARITGQVKDEMNKPIAAATVILARAEDSTMIKADVTDAEGKFDFNVDSGGPFLLSYSSIGFEKMYSPIFTLVENEVFRTMDVILKTEKKTLRRVTVSSRKPMIEVKADKTVFN